MGNALQTLTPLMLSHSLGGFDLLIAAVVLESGGLLYTFNLKHFRAVPGLIAVAP